ncbi:MAG: hypothetical protein A4E63_00387 [Syntrophorhabdus sp. PtaU1.Bin050]|nr:MAG: hypothetical protein A4E63_00387 [Syntrophorhabdus sp. PtaU1.Bin050]
MTTGTREWEKQHLDQGGLKKTRDAEKPGLHACGGCNACHEMTRVHHGGNMTALSGAGAEGPNLQKPCATTFFQRNLGNTFLQSRSLGESKSSGEQSRPGAAVPSIQKKCNCGGSGGNCSDKEEETRTIQPKLTMGSAHDIYEQEADRVAETVLAMTENQIPSGNSGPAGTVAAGTPEVRRQPEGSVEEETEEELGQPLDWNMPEPIESAQPLPLLGETGRQEGLQAKGASDTPVSVGASIAHALNTTGRSLDTSVRSFFEPRFGVSFDGVRIHTDTDAADSARACNALAYTAGHDIVFGPGQYTPETPQGRRLIAHELTHVIQQSTALSEKQPSQVQRSTGRMSVTEGVLIQRWVIGNPAPGINTIVCNGSGGIDTQLGATGNAQQTACLRDCIEAHEQSHRSDALAENANICSGTTAGKTVCPSNAAQRKDTEIRASNVEINCLKGKLPTADATCKPIINARITQIEAYRDSFK